MALVLIGSLLTARLEAQRNGSGFGRSGRFHAGQRFSQHTGFYSPYFFPDQLQDELPDDQMYWTQETEHEPLQRILYSPPAPEQPVRDAMLIEIPGASRDREAAPSPPAIFVLTNGERLEAQRFLLTATSLTVNISRAQRVIPLTALDLDSTMAANRQRGVRLQIPTEHNEIVLGF